jgi:hypothetical protein
VETVAACGVGLVPGKRDVSWPLRELPCDRLARSPQHLRNAYMTDAPASVGARTLIAT